MIILLCAGCPKGRQTAVDALAPLLAEADAAWDRRGTNGLEPVTVALQRAYSLRPESPEVAWRLARLGIAKGLTLEEEADRVAAFGEARAQAWSCVMGDPHVRALEIEVGLDEALQAVPEERYACLVWAGHAWTRWLVEFGAAGAALDLADLDRVTVYARGLPSDPWLADWSSALVLAARPEWEGRDVQAAQAELRRVSNRERERLEPLVDLYLYAARGTDLEGPVRREIAHGRPDTPEERAYVARALALPGDRGDVEPDDTP